MGAHLLQQLLYDKRYENIYCLVRPKSNRLLIRDLESEIEVVHGDLEDVMLLKDLCNESNHVYHCAAKISYQPKDKQELLKVNVQGTRDLVNCSLEGGITKFLHVSSIAVFGKEPSSAPINETVSWKENGNNSFYGYTKYLSELEVWRGLTEGLPSIIVNPSLILGSGRFNSGSSNIFHKINKGLRYYPIGGTGFVDARDVAEFCSKAILKDHMLGERYILNAENSSFHELFQRIAAAFDNAPPDKAIRGILSRLLKARAHLAKLFRYSIPATLPVLKSSNETYKFDNSKSLRLEDFNYIDLNQTIQDTCQQYQAWVKTGQYTLLPIVH